MCSKCNKPLSDQAVFEFENKRLLDESLAVNGIEEDSEEELEEKDFTTSMLTSKYSFIHLSSS